MPVLVKISPLVKNFTAMRCNITIKLFNFAAIINLRTKNMKAIQKLSMLLVCLMLSLATFTSCEWDDSPEPEHPLYVTYTITAGTIQYTGPELLLPEIQAWIKANQIVYDKGVNYSTGDASEFAKTDAEAIKKYNDEFSPKFKAYLKELDSKLAGGTYGDNATVNATFYMAASRTQGQDGNLAYEEIQYVYPSTTN